jgi:hypothetical protein
LRKPTKVRSLVFQKAHENLFLATLTALCCGLGILSPVRAAAADYRANEVLISVAPENDTPEEAQKITAYGTILRYLPGLHLYRVQVAPSRAAGDAVAEAIPTLRKLPEVRSAEPNYIRHIFSMPNDTYYGRQFAIPRVQGDLAWSVWKPKQQVIIAILDTGVDSGHPDLTNKILRDANGIVGYDALTGQRSAALDVYGHGTHVAGIAAAQVNNGIGVAGIAGWNGQTGNSDTHFIKIMPVRVLGSDGSGDDATIAEGIVWAVDHGAKVINMSLGSTGYTSVLNNGCQYAWNHGAIVCAAAGNDGLSAVNYPAGDANVIAVAATDRNDKLTDYTNYGSWVQIAAPGGGDAAVDQIYSTTPTYNTHAADFTYTLNYDYLSGSSMSTPFVAGEAAMIMSQNPTLTNSQVYNLILTSVDPVSAYLTHKLASGAGRMNVYKALLAAGTGYTALTEPLSGIFFQNADSGQLALWTMSGQTVTNGKTINIAPSANTNLRAEADVNGDGQTDLIFQNSVTGQISVWYLSGTTVTGAANLAQAPEANWQLLGAGDFNADGQVDLVFQNTQTRQVAVWFLTGTSLSGGGLLNAVPAAGWSVVGVADITGGGRRDILFQNATTGQLAYWSVKGQAVVASGLFPTVPSANYHVIGITDLNGDNNPDLVFQNTQTGQLAVWYLNGILFKGGGAVSLTPATDWIAAGPR